MVPAELREGGKLQETGPPPEPTTWGGKAECLGLRGHSGTTCPGGTLPNPNPPHTYSHTYTPAHTHLSYIVGVPKPHKLVTDYSYRSVLTSHKRWSLRMPAERPQATLSRNPCPRQKKAVKSRTEQGSLVMWRWGETSPWKGQPKCSPVPQSCPARLFFLPDALSLLPSPSQGPTRLHIDMP